MVHKKREIAYLDTHVVLWLYDALTDKLSPSAKAAIENNEVYIAQIVRLELQALYELGYIKTRPEVIINHLSNAIGLHQSDVPMEKIITAAIKLTWTSDPFDRMIAAEALVTDFPLVTKNSSLRKHLKHSIW
jgi:PIN domain nuclease of toxin-antitoxin system